MNIALTGGTGVVGRHALHLLLAHPQVRSVVCLGRRAPDVTDPKLHACAVDLNDASAVANAIAEIDVAICCLGTTLKNAGSEAAFFRIDHDAVLTFAQAAKAKGASTFILVSSVGANAKSSSFYLRTKGQIENAVAELGFARCISLRPSFIDDQGARTESRLGEKIMLPLLRAAFSIAGKHSKYAPISAEIIARALVRLGTDRDPTETRGLQVIESDAIYAIAAHA